MSETSPSKEPKPESSEQTDQTSEKKAENSFSSGDLVRFAGNDKMPMGLYKITMIDETNAFIEQVQGTAMGNATLRSLEPFTPVPQTTPLSELNLAPDDGTGQRIFGNVFDTEDVPPATDMSTDAIEQRFQSRGISAPAWLMVDHATLIERVRRLEGES